MSTDIRELENLDDLRVVVALFERIWGRTDEPPLNADTLKALTHSGNYVAGAFAEGRLVGALVGWLGGDPRGLATIEVDDRSVGSVRQELNWPGNFTDAGSATLSAGPHAVRIAYSSGGWRPGSGAKAGALGPAALTPSDQREPVQTLPASRARSLCGRRLDWVEALR